MWEQTMIGRTPKETIESVKDRIAYTVISTFKIAIMVLLSI